MLNHNQETRLNLPVADVFHEAAENQYHYVFFWVGPVSFSHDHNQLLVFTGS